MPQVEVRLVGKFLIRGVRLELDSLMITANEASKLGGQTGVVFAEFCTYSSYHSPHELDLAAAEFVEWLGKAPGWGWAVDFLREQSVRHQETQSLLKGETQQSWIHVPIGDSRWEPKRYVPASVIPRVPLVRSLEDHLAGDAPVLPQPLPATWEEVTVRGIFSSDADPTKEV